MKDINIPIDIKPTNIILKSITFMSKYFFKGYCKEKEFQVILSFLYLLWYIRGKVAVRGDIKQFGAHKILLSLLIYSTREGIKP